MLRRQARPGTWALAMGATVIVISIVGLVWFRKPQKGKGKSAARSPLARLRRILAKTLGVISPGLGRSVQGENSKFVWFFDRLNDILAKEGVKRESTVTYEEFAQLASKKHATGDRSAEIGSTIQDLIDRLPKISFRWNRRCILRAVTDGSEPGSPGRSVAETRR